MKTVPAKGSVLEWARRFRGLDESEAASRLRISLSDLLAYERGQRLPSLEMFETFAAEYYMPQATLFAPEPPEEPPPLVDFRGNADDRSGPYSFYLCLVLSDARSFGYHLDRVAQDDGAHRPPELRQLTLSQDPVEAGEAERVRIGPTIDEQLRWTNRAVLGGSEAYCNWEILLERQGVSVINRDFAEGRGFSFYDSPNAPVVVLNDRQLTEAEKIFTLWHQYCHLLLRKPGLSDHNLQEPIEAFCFRFAAAFLIPEAALRFVLRPWPDEPVDWQRRDIERFAAKLNVCERVLAVRLENLGLAPSGFGEPFGCSDGQVVVFSTCHYVLRVLRNHGRNFTTTVMAARDRGAIDDFQCAQALGISPMDMDVARSVASDFNQELQDGAA